MDRPQRPLVDVYDSYGQHHPYEEDTAGLVAAVLTQVQQCGGSATEPTSAESVMLDRQ
ncbi:hypothetical protein [Streptomyces sp. enrichment culture]|uniref:hypothetical protein n=1 Tax=Streptomyces sp. enrichment culture TaxID=1795815 RepID=UPI003F5573CA